MKRTIISTLFTAALCLTLLSSSVYAWFFMLTEFYDGRMTGSSMTRYFEEGDGSEEDPYIISNQNQLYNLVWLQNKNYFTSDHSQSGTPATYYFKIQDGVTELDMAGYFEDGAVPPIGSDDNPFIGNFDGNGCVIKNLWVSSDPNEWIERPQNVHNATYTNGVGFFGTLGTVTSEIGETKTTAGNATNFFLQNIQVSVNAGDAYVGLIAGNVVGGLSRVGVADGVIVIKDDETAVTSNHTLVGQIDGVETEVWQDLAGNNAGGDLVIVTEDFLSAIPLNSTLSGTTPVEDALTGTAYYVGSLTTAQQKGGSPSLKDMTSGSAQNFSVGNVNDPKYKIKSKIQEAYDYFVAHSRPYLTMGGVPSTSDTTTVTDNNGQTLTVPKYGVWFKPQASGTIALAFAKANNANPAKKMALYKIERNSNVSIRSVTKVAEFELPRSLSNGTIVYYEYELQQSDVNQEFMIGAANSNSTGSAAGFLAMALAGTSLYDGGQANGVFTTTHLEKIEFVEVAQIDTPAEAAAFFDDATYAPNVYVSGNTNLAIVSQTASTAPAVLKFREENGVVHYTSPVNNVAVTELIADNPASSTSAPSGAYPTVRELPSP